MNTEPKKDKLLDPKDNIIRLNNSQSVANYIFIAKIVLSKFDEVELTALGGVTKQVVRVAENLQRDGFVTISSCKTGQMEQNNKFGRQTKVCSISVKIRKTPEFNEKTKGLLKENREEQKK